MVDSTCMGLGALAGYVFGDSKKSVYKWALIGTLIGSSDKALVDEKTPAPTQAPVENTQGASFLNHENDFNTSAQNNKKTLALTAKDFSPAPQKSLAA